MATATARRVPALEALGAVMLLALLVCFPPSGAGAAEDAAAAAAATRGGPAALESGLPLGPAPFIGLDERRLALDNSEDGVALDEPINPLSVGRATHGVPSAQPPVLTAAPTGPATTASPFPPPLPAIVPVRHVALSRDLAVILVLILTGYLCKDANVMAVRPWAMARLRCRWGTLPCTAGRAPTCSWQGLTHSSTLQLNLSAFCVTGGAVRGCCGGV
jgi:hypothetical protein